MIHAAAHDRRRQASRFTAGDGNILLAHGGGGQLTDELLQTAVLPRLGNDLLNPLLDSAIFPAPSPGGRPALTIDSYVVQPWKFPGGDIGRLAVCGTVNDLAVCGARPCGVALSLILAEGLPRTTLEEVLDSIAAAAREADVHVVTGDTKVVGRGQADGLYITTAGLGWIEQGTPSLHPRGVEPDDVILINGCIGDHGLAVMLTREMPEVQSVLRSDAAPLNGLIGLLFKELGDDVVFLRDVTRGGLAGVAADLARDCQQDVVLDEASIPVAPATQHAAEMLGIDPLDVANEGKFIAVVRPAAKTRALRLMQGHPLGINASVIGSVQPSAHAVCQLHTEIGGRRIVQKPYGEQLPRIC